MHKVKKEDIIRIKCMKYEYYKIEEFLKKINNVIVNYKKYKAQYHSFNIRKELY